MPETRDDRGRTALHIAAINNQVDITRYLLKCNSDVEAIDNDGRTPLHFALSGGDSKPMQSICRLLLDHHAAADVQDSNGDTPLHIAVANHSLEHVEILLDSGAHPGIHNKIGELPVDLADEVIGRLFQDYSGFGWEDRGYKGKLGKALITRAIKPISWRKGLVDARDEFGRSALHFAALKNRQSTVSLLLERNADINAVDEQGRTPLHFATARNVVRVTRLLLENGAKVNALDNRGESAFHLAAESGYPDDTGYPNDLRPPNKIMKLLIEFGASQVIKNKNEGEWRNRYLGSFSPQGDLRSPFLDN